MNSGVGCPVAGKIESVNGKRPSGLPVKEPFNVALEDGVPAGGADVVLNEFTSATPVVVDAPSELIRPDKF